MQKAPQWRLADAMNTRDPSYIVNSLRTQRPLRVTLVVTMLLLSGSISRIDAATRRLPTGAEARAVAAIEQQGRLNVADLVRRINAASDQSERRALSQQIVDQKIQSDLDVLRALSRAARAGQLVGHAEVVDTGEVVSIRSVDELTLLLQRLAGEATSPATEAGAS